MRITENYTFFYSTDEPFSNWYSAPVIEEGNLFLTNEHYMMFHKAKLFHDDEIAHKILRVETPKEAKFLGRQVKNFNENTWIEKAKDIVFWGAYIKFTCYPSLLYKLLDTQKTTLVEASKFDTIWGVGLSQDDDAILDPKNWRGKNWLGEVLTSLRNKFQKGL